MGTVSEGGALAGALAGVLAGALAGALAGDADPSQHKKTGYTFALPARRSGRDGLGYWK